MIAAAELVLDSSGICDLNPGVAVTKIRTHFGSCGDVQIPGIARGVLLAVIPGPDGVPGGKNAIRLGAELLPGYCLNSLLKLLCRLTVRCEKESSFITGIIPVD